MMTPDNNAEKRQDKRAGERTNLDRQYGTIGISAVLAALRYQGETKNPAYAPARRREDERFEAAA